ncbi:endonuclease [Halomonas sp. GXIMD04776]|uniref:endonuclease n=1 Tax=Halomonas sp. GXIMD04776 TaxID=3415605 RepID=UPI003C837463
MSKVKKKQIVRALLEMHGRTFVRELGIELKRNTPSPLFRLLCLSLLTSAPLGAGAAMRACKALGSAGWTTPAKMADSTWEERVKVLNENGYARYDEKTARQLGILTDHVQETYEGDLRRLRSEANGDIKKARRLLKEFKGIGGVGADIFLREVQVCWDEFRPFADKMALKSSGKLNLGDDAETLAERVDSNDFTRLVAALVRTQLAKDHDRVLEVAGAS